MAWSLIGKRGSAMSNVECLWDAKATLGEGARYDAATNQLWWVDILGQKIFRLDLASGDKKIWDTPETVGCTFPDGKGGALALFKHSLVQLNVTDGSFETVLTFADEPAHNRFNDGLQAADGSLWLGSMDYDCVQATGVLYHVHPDLSVRVVDTGYICINGPAISADGTRLYVNETMKAQVFVCDLDPASGAISNKRLFAKFAENEGLTDGIYADPAGGLWVAMAGGGHIRRYHADGSIDREIALPSPTVTSVCPGPDANTLFVTTGRILMDDETLAAHPLSGGLFRVTL
jgi:xylono-1,5-lactonase